MALINKKVYVAHPEGMFDAIIVSVDEHTIDTEKGSVDGYNVRIKTDEGEIIPFVSGTYSVKSNLGKITQAAMGKMPDTLDTDWLPGRPCRIVVAHELRGDLTVDKIISYLPPKGAGDLFAG